MKNKVTSLVLVILLLIFTVLNVTMCSTYIPPTYDNTDESDKDDADINTPEEPETPNTPETPSVPETPSEPETPSTPDVPNTPDTPEEDTRINVSEFNYVAFGDSITCGIYYNGTWNTMPKPYPTIVAESLGLKSVKNLALSGATLCSNDLGLACMTDRILSFNEDADIISIMLGVNDWARNLPLGNIDDHGKNSIYGCLNMICEHLVSKYADSLVFFMTPYKTSWTVNQEYALSDVANAIKEVASVYGIPVLDMYNEGRYELEMNNPTYDGLHPSEDFVINYTAPQIVEFIKTKLGIKFYSSIYAAFGDSITYGADHNNNYEQVNDPYPELVAKQLGMLAYENHASSGATFCKNDRGLTCMTDRITSYTGNADIISVLLGFNDWAREFPIGTIDDRTNETIYGCLHLICEYLTTSYPDAFVFIMTPYKTALIRNQFYTLNDVVNAIKEVALIYDVPVLDLYNEGRYELEMYEAYSDGVHPTQEFFCQYTTPQIAEFIINNYN